MPVYNSEQYLSKAIESILLQSFGNFELILVNDGSSDNSGDICDQFASKDKRVIVIHQQNSGISSARNTGLEVACGEYIAFADNDDEFALNLLEDNIKLAKKYDADIVKFGVSYYTISEKEKNKVKIRDVDFETFNKEEIKNSYLYLKNNNLLVYVWDSLFRKSLIDSSNVHFNTDLKYGGEDINFNLSLLQHINKLIVNPKEYYTHYKRYSHSTAVIFNSNKLAAYVVNAKLEYETLRDFLPSPQVNLIWAECLSSYIVQISHALSKTDSFSKVDTKSFINNLTVHEGFNVKVLYRDLLKIFTRNKKRAIVLYLYKRKYYSLLYKLVLFSTRKI
ncbi:glycosyltransferase family 2 protein [Rossellomorea marisflavi]|uniref:glycosyltransferase family 2 protein n=1 Tax=Rossellomorea marisflavi TaxID=189381 RepID=UPI003F9F7291